MISAFSNIFSSVCIWMDNIKITSAYKTSWFCYNAEKYFYQSAVTEHKLLNELVCFNENGWQKLGIPIFLLQCMENNVTIKVRRCQCNAKTLLKTHYLVCKNSLLSILLVIKCSQTCQFLPENFAPLECR
jgi:hypothetical protein